MKKLLAKLIWRTFLVVFMSMVGSFCGTHSQSYRLSLFYLFTDLWNNYFFRRLVSMKISSIIFWNLSWKYYHYVQSFLTFSSFITIVLTIVLKIVSDKTKHFRWKLISFRPESRRNVRSFKRKVCSGVEKYWKVGILILNKVFGRPTKNHSLIPAFGLILRADCAPQCTGGSVFFSHV